jgi:hypothetical protein
MPKVKKIYHRERGGRGVEDARIKDTMCMALSD